MGRRASADFPVLPPSLQVSFFHRLREVEARYLGPALSAVVAKLSLPGLDAELALYANGSGLQRAAASGIRGEVVFPVPLVLRESPFLLAYYRLLFGISQKEFYNKGPFGMFRTLEEVGELSPRCEHDLPKLCRSLCRTANALLDGLGAVSIGTVRDLQVLTLGPQLRGAENNRIGQRATREVFDLLSRLVKPYAVDQTNRTLLVRNSAGRNVLIEFFADPDVRVTETSAAAPRPLLAIEVKGGGDESNLHNRLGEAEKSHHKARALGFQHRWTLVRTTLRRAVARSESPSTTEFFRLDAIQRPRTHEHKRFVDAFAAIVGIPSPH